MSDLVSLDEKDVFWCVRHLPGQLTSLLQKHRGLAVVAGGFIRARIAGEQAADIDVFAPDADKAKAWACELAAGTGLKLIETQNAMTVLGLALPVQFIHRWCYTAPSELIESFDFTIAKTAIWYGPKGSQWLSLADPRFYCDLAAKRLIYTKPQRNEDAGGSMLRVLKFYQRGYRIPLDSLSDVMARLVAAIDVNTLVGTKAFADGETVWTEEFVSGHIHGLLREVDPLVEGGVREH